MVQRKGICMIQGTSSELGQWLKERCQKEGLSLRQAGSKTGLSHATVRDIINGGKASSVTIRKLAETFGGNGEAKLALEDKLLILAGYRTERMEGELTEPVARLIDRVRDFNEEKLKIMSRFADFLAAMEGK